MPDVFTQYSSVMPFVQSDEAINWVPESERERLQSYIKYDQMYWNETKAFELMRRGTEANPLILPNPKAIVDPTAHFLLKGLRLEAKGNAQKRLDDFCKRERFQSRFGVAKHTGVVKGDWLMHITADPDEEEEHKVSLTSVDPGSYFPVYDDDDLDKLIKVHLAYMFKDGDGKDAIKRLTYEKIELDGRKRISVYEAIFESEREKWMGEKPPLKRLINEDVLPESITTIPVYHFKNQDWQGQPFGSSELRGYERVLQSQNQTMTDEEIALALEGLGVYATDGGPPVDDDGNDIAWEISPARVMEVATGAYFKRVEGISSIAPMLEHAKYLNDNMHEAAGTFRSGSIDVQVAESGISLAIRFIPTTAKLEHRDQDGVDTLQQMWYDWSFWEEEFEGSVKGGTEIEVKLGEKLPINREEVISELNNMHDRKIISGAYYRSQMNKLFGYTFPADDAMDQEIVDEQTRWAEFKSNIDQQQEEAAGLTDKQKMKSGNPSNPNEPTVKNGNRSNNRGAPNESKGTEAKQTLQRQQRSRG